MAFNRQASACNGYDSAAERLSRIAGILDLRAWRI